MIDELERLKQIKNEILFVEQLLNMKVQNTSIVEEQLLLLLKKYEKQIKPYLQEQNVDMVAHKITDDLKNGLEYPKKSYKEIFIKLLEILKNQSLLIDKIKNKEIYIDSNIMELLKIESTVLNLKQIILYNKSVNDKKNGVFVNKEKKETLKQTQTISTNSDRVKTKSKKKNRKSIAKFEAIIFDDLQELIDYTKKEFNVLMPNDLYGRNFYEMCAIVNVLRMKSLKGIEQNSNFVEQILKYSCFDIIKDIAIALERTRYNLNDLLKIKSIFFSSNVEFEENSEVIKGNYEEQIEFLYDIEHCMFVPSKEEKIEVLRKNNIKIKRFLLNSIIFCIYNIYNLRTTNILFNKYDIELIDRMVECGLLDLEYYFTKTNSNSKNEYPLEIYMFLNYYQSIYGFIKIRSTDEEIEKINNIVCEKLNKKGMFITNNPLYNFKANISKNKCLSEQNEISKMSKYHLEEIILTQKEFTNEYINFLDCNFLGKDKLTYIIRVEDKIYVNISRNKVIRLLSEHTIQEHEITLDLVKSCMFYNLIITDEVLEKLDEKLNEILSNAHFKQNKI